MEETAPEFPHKGPSRSGTNFGYRVEARNSSLLPPRQVGGQIFDAKWREVIFHKSKVGVPQTAEHEHELLMSDLLSYPASQALRWWFHALASQELMDTCIETRLVKYKVEYTVKITAEGAYAVVSSEDNSNVRPDYVNKEKAQ